jgi:hypothetical protein
VESEAKHPPLALVVSLGAVEDRVPLNGEALHARHDGEYYVILLTPLLPPPILHCLICSSCAWTFPLPRCNSHTKDNPFATGAIGRKCYCPSWPSVPTPQKSGGSTRLEPPSRIAAMQSIGGICAGTSGRVHGQSASVFSTDTRSGALRAQSPGKVAAPACTAEIDAMQSTVSSLLICARAVWRASSRTKYGTKRLQVQCRRHDLPPLPLSRPRTHEYSSYEAASISPETPPTLCRSYSAERPLAQGRALPVARPTNAAQAYMEVNSLPMQHNSGAASMQRKPDRRTPFGGQ